MNIGELNRRIEVLQFFEERDEFGGVDGQWLPVGRVWAKIEPGSGNEYFSKQKVNAENNTKITVRFYAGISEMNRIRYGDKLYEIVGIADHRTAHNMTIINCKEMVSDGLQRKAAESQDDD
ncbi:MAG: phage head closure protein [Clostridia bacterium]|nr:phage head closure protein [Clostridia bacterium]